jgi:hypothetical protein
MNPMKAIDPGLMFDIDLEEQISLSKKKKKIQNCHIVL